ncbi:hypothetical protein [Clostridium ganghwense]|uniref:Dipeptidyl-peptidase IV n=1 Tax=Clostridium ganghwense TaxID=312089 RepID=A0ABT4CKV0_9CLOT|nr:hypothetical protein [Clostridium ganghwense]MCY6369653.1 hypothetical protein [Clostridium ganghwense]
MKALKRIMIWVFISLTAQMAVLYYVDNYLFATENVNAVVSKKVVKEKKQKKKDVAIIVPEDAQHVAVSYDGGYLSYYKDDVLKVVDAYTGEEHDVEFEDNLKVSFYKWAPDRDRILLAIKKKSGSSAKYVFYSYDAEKNKKDILQTKEGQETSIRTSNNSYIEDIQLTPLTNMIYVKTALKGGRSSIYNINVMKRIEKVRTEAYFIGNTRIIPNDDRLVYESADKGKVYITGTRSSISIEGVKKLCLLSVDGDDRIYVGELEEDKVSKIAKVKHIYYGTAEQDTNEWKKISLSEAVNKKDIFVSSSGKIYINNNLRGTVTELNSNKDTVYKGIFMQMYDEGIASISDGKLAETPLK